MASCVYWTGEWFCALREGHAGPHSNDPRTPEPKELVPMWVNKHSAVAEDSMLRTTSDVPMYRVEDVKVWAQRMHKPHAEFGSENSGYNKCLDDILSQLRGVGRE